MCVPSCRGGQSRQWQKKTRTEPISFASTLHHMEERLHADSKRIRHANRHLRKLPNTSKSISVKYRRQTKPKLRSVTKIRPEESCVRHQSMKENPNAPLFAEREDGEEAARVKAWKFHNSIHKTKGTHHDARLKFSRPRRHLATCRSSWRPGVHHRT